MKISLYWLFVNLREQTSHYSDFTSIYAGSSPLKTTIPFNLFGRIPQKFEPYSQTVTILRPNTDLLFKNPAYYENIYRDKTPPVRGDERWMYWLLEQELLVLRQAEDYRNSDTALGS